MKPSAKDQASDSVVPVPSSPSAKPTTADNGMERQFSFFSIIGLAFAILNVSVFVHFVWRMLE